MAYIKKQHRVLLSIILLFIVPSIYGQRIIKGRVINQSLDILPYVGVVVNDSIDVGTTDLQGYFEVNVPANTKSLDFKAITFERATIFIDENCSYLEVVMLHSGYSETISSGKELDRVRKKRFDKLPVLYAEAFKKGIFKNDAPCYKQTFQPEGPGFDELGRRVDALLAQDKKDFKKLAVGDTIRVPFGTSYGSDGTDRTTLDRYSSVVEGRKFNCIIKGVVIAKNRHRRGYNITYRVTDISKCKYPAIILHGKDVVTGEVLTVNMKYFKVLTH